MPTQGWFPTYVYEAPLAGKTSARYAQQLLEECRQLRDYDDAGRRWCAEHYPGGYTSYGTLPQLHQFSSSFTDLQRRLDRHVARFARHLEYDLQGGRLEMVDCWVNILPRHIQHGSHIHPLSVISGTFYVATPPGCAPLRFEDPRLGFMMGQPPRRARCRPESRQHVPYAPEAGRVILFESWLRHEVSGNRADGERVSVSFNYQWV